MRRYLCLVALLAFNKALLAAVGCMDSSYHAHPYYGPDYKRLFYVPCDCPCWRYRWAPKKALCLNCRHFHKPNEVSATTPEQLPIPNLRAIEQKGKVCVRIK